MARKKKNTKIKQAESYRHSEATSPLRPDVKAKEARTKEKKIN